MGFNGAASLQRRKGWNPLSRVLRMFSFNGAASLQRRKGVDGLGAVAGSGALQWGRLSSEAEGSLLRAMNNHLVQASMGPPLFRGGRSPIARTSRTTSRGFNGAASLQRRKAPSGVGVARKSGCFNGAASLQRRKGEAWAGVARALVASMGPPLFRGGRLPTLENTMAEKKSFNGAASLQRRKDVGHRGGVGVCEASMGPPLFRGGRRAKHGLNAARSGASMGPPLFRGGR